MGNSVVKETVSAANTSPIIETVATSEKPKCKACCACPETKKVRDAW